MVTGDAVTNSGIRLYKGANMPPCGGQAIAMSNAQLFLDENTIFNIGEVDFSGNGEIVGGLATVQCMYAPEFTAHSSAERVEAK